MKIITQIRTYKTSWTESLVVMPDGRTFYGLEDTGRPMGVKFMGETCIPEGCYDLELTMSARFKRKLPILFNRRGYVLERHGIRFTGIRAHGGNDTRDTAGCPLVGTRKGERTVHNCAPAVNFICAEMERHRNEKWKWVVTS